MSNCIDFQCEKNAKKDSFCVEKECEIVVDTGTFIRQIDFVFRFEMTSKFVTNLNLNLILFHNLFQFHMGLKNNFLSQFQYKTVFVQTPL